MEVLNALFRLADHLGWLAPLRSRAIRHRVSLYADHLVVFITPCERDFKLTAAILEIFAGASGLHTNVSKCQLTPIRCCPDQVQLVQRLFPCQLANFPFKYLGVPLSIWKLSKSEMQPLVDAVVDRLPNWKGRLMSRAERTTLTKVTLSTIPIHISIAVSVRPNIYRAIDNIRRAFVWNGTDHVHGGKCLVSWPRVTRSVELGGLGILIWLPWAMR
jgi:hypothetical protein